MTNDFTPEQRAAIEKAKTTEMDLFRSGLDKECRDVARRIYREAVKRNDGPRSLPRASAYFAAVATLRRLAMRLHRSYENACNREQSERELRRERRTEARVLQLCHELGVSVRFNGDPRGGPVQIPCSKEEANGWGGDCILVPFADAREYDRK
jgi:hypothetical protein